MQQRWYFPAALFLIVATQPAAAAPRVQLELATQEGFQATESRVWYELFTRLKVAGLRIRGMEAGDTPRIDSSGTGATRSYRVTGILTTRGELILPGGRFTSRDAAGIAAWLEDLQQNGPPGEPRPVKVFGLDDDMIARIRKDLSQRVEDATAGQRRSDVLSKITGGLRVRTTVAPGVSNSLDNAGLLAEELQGVASGTALAYVLRPAGLALVPRAASSGYELQVVAAKGVSEIWPVGLPAEDRRRELLPTLSEVIEVEIDKGTELTKALAAIQGRLKVPFLVDHNSLAAEGIDLDKATVQLPARKLNYSIILGSLLGQARLVYELRSDEAGQPFIWITTFRRR